MITDEAIKEGYLNRFQRPMAQRDLKAFKELASMVNVSLDNDFETIHQRVSDQLLFIANYGMGAEA